MSETGTQTAVNVETASVQEPIEVVGGSSPVSWDELGAVDNWRKGLSDEPEVKTAQRRSEEGDELEEALSTKEEKGAKHAKEKSSEEKSSKEKNEVTSKTKEKQHKETKEALKTLKFKQGESSLDVSPDALVSVKVDGKNVEVPVQEVINRYSQQKHLDDLYRKHKTERQEFETQRAGLQEALAKTQELLIEKKDLKGFMEFISEATGQDGQQLYNEAVDKIRQVIEEESTLTPEERRLKQLEEENNFYKAKAESAKLAEKQKLEIQQLEKTVETVISDLSMSKSDFVKAYDELVENGFTAEQLTPDLIGKYWSNQQLVAGIENKLESIAPGLAKDQARVEKLATLAIQTDANQSEIEEAIEQLYGLQPEKKLANKMRKTLKQKQAEQGVKRAGSDTMFFDDL